MSTSQTPAPEQPQQQQGGPSLYTRLKDTLPAKFSPSALSLLPTNPARRAKAKRADDYPDEETDARYTTIPRPDGTGHIRVRIPKKVATPVRVEPKVWFANERTWVSYINVSILLGTLALALYNSAHDPVGRAFGIVYAVISAITLVYGWWVYQKRLTMIRRRDPGHFDQILGPVLICAALFVAVLVNFLQRVSDRARKV